MIEKVNIRGVEFDNLTLDEAVDYIFDRMKSGDKTVVYTPNSEIVQACIEDKEFQDIIASADIRVADGIGVVKAARILKTPLKGRVAGVEVGEQIIKKSGEEGYKIFFLGGKPGVAEAAFEKLHEKYPQAVFAGSHHGYFDKSGDENNSVIEKINAADADILFVFLGAPAQEKWIFQNKDKLPSIKLFMGLGGSIDIYSGNLKRAPKFFIKFGLEWFYRLICDPKRIGRMMKLPKFYFGTYIYKIKNKK